MPLKFVHPLQRATHRIGLYLAELREHGLTQGEAHILALLADSSPATVTDLHRGLAHRRSTLTSILDRLADRKLITRNVGKSDRRTFDIGLTGQGRTVAGRVSRHLAELERRVRRQLDSSDLRGFNNVIGALEMEAGRNERRTR
jgi:DNA-binding MarR family transcriptional regulator